MSPKLDHMDRFNWDKLRVFRAVAQCGSISAAARLLGESPPTVSRKVDDLERSLNSILFKRSTKGIDLTDAGHQALRHTEAMAEAADALNRDVSDIDLPAEGKVRLITGDGLGPHWIAPRLPQFQQEYPKIQLELMTANTPADILGGECDIAIQFIEPRHQDLIAKKLGTLHYMCFASQDYLDTYGTPKSIFEFHNHRCIFHEAYVNQLEKWPQKTHKLSQILDYSLITNSGAVMLSVCAAGGGIAVLPSYVADFQNDLIPLEISEVAPINFWLSYTERVRRLTKGQAVLTWLKEVFDPIEHPYFRSTFVRPERDSNIDDCARRTEINAVTVKD